MLDEFNEQVDSLEDAADDFDLDLEEIDFEHDEETCTDCLKEDKEAAAMMSTLVLGVGFLFTALAVWYMSRTCMVKASSDQTRTRAQYENARKVETVDDTSVDIELHDRNIQISMEAAKDGQY